MRDVTDNVTGDLPGVEQKRGRGRPRSVHAMTNAERQAAFRARRKAQQPVEAKSVTKRMTVTEMLSDVDSYGDCRLEVEALREQLENMRQQCLAAVERHGDVELQLVRVQAELVDLQERLNRSVRLHHDTSTWAQQLDRQCKALKAELASAHEAIDNYKIELLKAYGKVGGDQVVAKPVTRKRVTKKPSEEKVVTKVCSLE